MANLSNISQDRSQKPILKPSSYTEDASLRLKLTPSENNKQTRYDIIDQGPKTAGKVMEARVSSAKKKMTKIFRAFTFSIPDDGKTNKSGNHVNKSIALDYPSVVEESIETDTTRYLNISIQPTTSRDVSRRSRNVSILRMGPTSVSATNRPSTQNEISVLKDTIIPLPSPQIKYRSTSLKERSGETSLVKLTPTQSPAMRNLSAGREKSPAPSFSRMDSTESRTKVPISKNVSKETINGARPTSLLISPSIRGRSTSQDVSKSVTLSAIKESARSRTAKLDNSSGTPLEGSLNSIPENRRYVSIDTRRGGRVESFQKIVGSSGGLDGLKKERYVRFFENSMKKAFRMTEAKKTVREEVAEKLRAKAKAKKDSAKTKEFDIYSKVDMDMLNSSIDGQKSAREDREERGGEKKKEMVEFVFYREINEMIQFAMRENDIELFLRSLKLLGTMYMHYDKLDEAFHCFCQLVRGKKLGISLTI